MKVDDLVEFAVPVGTDDFVAIHPCDRLERVGVIEENVVVVRGGEEVVRFPERMERVNDVATERADLADGLFQPLFEDG